MGDLDEPIGIRHLDCPPFHRGPLDLHCPPALAAHEVMVVAVGVAPAVTGFAVVAANGIELARVRHRPHLVVDGREPYVLTTGLELGMELLSGTKPLRGVEDRGEGALLPRRTLPGCAARRLVCAGFRVDDQLSF